MAAARYIIATAWHSKEQLYKSFANPKAPQLRPATVTVSTSGDYQPQEATKAGEDALFHAREPTSGRLVFGVADGVGGWAEEGVDPSLFSRGLLHNVHDRVVQTSPESSSDLNPVALINQAYRRILTEGKMEKGGSTVTLGTLEPQSGRLTMAQLGDSTYSIVRQRHTTFYTSEEQVHGFNFPFQLSAYSPSQKAWAEKTLDRPEKAIMQDFNLQPDDLVVVGTDGVFDNIYPQDVLDTVRDHLNEGRLGKLIKTLSESDQPITQDTMHQVELISLAHTAQSLVDLAVRHSLRQNYLSPFAKRAQAASMRYSSG
ncbi:Protein phosphatase 2C 7 [Dispira simplex]|nr:Protein phosphatase 2C 7 [Dispira simplex]